MSDNIPFDLQIEIMHKLPVKSLLQFRSVSKRWKSTIDFSDFIRRYGFRETDMCCFNLTYMQMSVGFMFSVDDNFAFTPQQTNLNLPTLKPIATSEGVWCFSWGSDMCLVIWNPSIKKSVGKLVPYLTNQPDHPKMVFGFGVRPDKLDSTLLKINYSFNVQGPWYVSVFTLSSNRWINLENDRLPSQSIKLKRYGQAVVGGKIFWVGSEKFYSNDGSLQKSYMLVSFDLVTHHFHVVDIPREIRFMIPPPFYISQLGTSLVISGSFIQDVRKYMSAWVLEFVGVILTSFEVLFTIPFPIDHVVKLLGFSKNVEPIVETKSSQQTAQLLQVYDRTTQEFQNMGIEANDGSFFIGPYKESLILHSLANE